MISNLPASTPKTCSCMSTQWHITIDHLRLRSKRLRAGGPEAGQRLRIPACKEGDVMALANHFFRKVRDDSLRASV